MNNFTLLIWITIIVILNVRGEVRIMDNTTICKHCNSGTLSPCSEVEEMAYNLTIRCQLADEQDCVIALAEGVGDKNATDYMCLLSGQIINVNNYAATNKLSKLLEDEETTTIMENMENELEVAHASKEAIEDTPNIESAGEETVNAVNDAPTSKESSKEASDVMPAVTVISADDAPTSKESSKEVTDNMPAETVSPVKVNDQHQTETTESMQADHPIEMDVIEKIPETLNDNNIETAAETPTVMDQSPTTESNKDMEKESNAGNSISTSVVDIKFHKCFACTSTDEPSCVSKPTQDMECKNVETLAAGCYTLFKDAQIKRGCVDNLDAQQLLQCHNITDRSCIICNTHNCNDKPWPRCFACNSNVAGSLCATWPVNVSLSHLERHCGAFDDVCRLMINEDGATIRDCVSQGTNCDSETISHCRVCAERLCNSGIFPMERRRCHQCIGTESCALEQNLSNAMPCSNYDINEQCFLFADEHGKMHRGCKSSKKSFQHCTQFDDKRCLTCSNRDGCNDQPLLIAPELACSQCDSRVRSSRNAHDCAWAQSISNVTPCQNKRPYYIPESCEMIYQPDIEVAVRGCSQDFGVCEPTNIWCSDCTTNACNIGNLIWQHCLQCSSDAVESCGTDAKGIIAQRCQRPLQTYELRGCYTSMSLETNVTTRGCISDMTAADINYCKTNKKICVLCYEQECNNLMAPSKAMKLFASNGVGLIILGLIIYSLL